MRKNYTSEFKTKFVLEVFRGERLLNDIASENNVHLNMLTRWKTEASKIVLTKRGTLMAAVKFLKRYSETWGRDSILL